MTQGDFTKQEASRTLETVSDLFDGLSKSKRMGYIGHLNDICLFLEAARRAAPDKPETDTE